MRGRGTSWRQGTRRSRKLTACALQFIWNTITAPEFAILAARHCEPRSRHGLPEGRIIGRTTPGKRSFPDQPRSRGVFQRRDGLPFGRHTPSIEIELVGEKQYRGFSRIVFLGMPPYRRTVGWCVFFHPRNSCGHRALPPLRSKCQEGRQNRSRTLWM